MAALFTCRPRHVHFMLLHYGKYDDDGSLRARIHTNKVLSEENETSERPCNEADGAANRAKKRRNYRGLDSLNKQPRSWTRSGQKQMLFADFDCLELKKRQAFSILGNRIGPKKNPWVTPAQEQCDEIDQTGVVSLHNRTNKAKHLRLE